MLDLQLGHPVASRPRAPDVRGESGARRPAAPAAQGEIDTLPTALEARVEATAPLSPTLETRDLL